ncbi:MAG: MFS transporter [Chloroflexi bacterium]|nr:MFS transporter [Chloroflexota bacterium]
MAGERTESSPLAIDTPDGALAQSTSAFRYGKFRIWWAGSFAAAAGVRLNQVSLTVLVFDITGNALDLGVLAASTALPTIIVSMFGGVLADRLNTRMVLAFSTSIIATVLSVIAVLVITNSIELWHVFALAALNGVALGMDEPARETYFTSLIPKVALRSAVTNNGALRASNSVLMPTLGGVIISIAGLSAAFFIAAGAWGLMLATLLFLPSRHVISASRNPIKDLSEGVRYIAQRRVFLAIIGLSFANIFFGAGWIQILPAYVDRFDGDATQVGFLFSAAGLGALTGIILSGRLNSTQYVGRVIIGACLLFSTSLLVIAISPGMAVSIPAAYVAHLGNGLFMMSSRTAIQLRVEDHVRGRVMGIVAITNSLFVLSGLFTGSMAAAFGVKTGMLIGPVIVIAAALIMMTTQRELRNLDGRPVADD